MAVQENIEEGKGSMTDQEYEKELAELMNSAPSDEKKHKKGRIRRAFKAIGSWSRRRKLITGAVAVRWQQPSLCLYVSKYPALEDRRESR